MNPSSLPPPAPPRTDWRPVLVLTASAGLWGLMWWPLKGFAAQGLQGPWMTLVSDGLLGLAGLPWLWRERRAWQPEAGRLLALAVVSGWAHAAFVQALVSGQVVRTMLLFYMAPAWAVLGGALFLGERIGARRALAVGLALAGAASVIGARGIFDAAMGLSDLLALTAGIAFAGNNVIARASPRTPMASKSVAAFLGCALVSAVWVAVQGLNWPAPAPGVQIALLAFAFGWLAVATVSWQYGVSRMEAGRSGVIMTLELLIATGSAILIGGETMGPAELLGGALIVTAAWLEATAPEPGVSRPD